MSVASTIGPLVPIRAIRYRSSASSTVIPYSEAAGPPLKSSMRKRESALINRSVGKEQFHLRSFATQAAEFDPKLADTTLTEVVRLNDCPVGDRYFPMT